MAELYISLLVAALCIGTAVSLQCYTCASVTSNANCMTTTNCSSNNTYCQTSVASALGLSVINKTCSSSCTSASASFAGFSSSVSCCSSDLCNVSGSSAVKYSFPALGLSLGFLLVLLRSSAL
ncbi:ly6/PLAUR domain-containing protein 2-like [Xenopus laevis]|uniref:Ly6/PLAUR domain-containing protein 2-like n=1 Tax=Xenopus laevis TaxID=8355 RepID=A0A8J1KZ84_XENLA|nr:ly6/PLAUR domain-containing protein 2-like [Xenopus laevis]